MPYIKQEQRRVLDDIIEDAEFDLAPDGRLNYFLFKLMIQRRQIEGESYQFYKNYCAELRACAREIERRHMAQYEDKKKIESGDVE